jgi:hypothetical protein
MTDELRIQALQAALDHANMMVIEQNEAMRMALQALEEALEAMKCDWYQIDSEWGPSEGGLEAAIDGRLTGYGYFKKTIDAITALRVVLGEAK